MAVWQRTWMLGAILGLSCMATSVQALTIDSNLQGKVNSAGVTNGAAQNSDTYTGIFEQKHYNSWANFSLAGLTGTVISAQLELRTAVSSYEPSASYQIGVYDANTAWQSFANHTAGTGGFSDLGSGKQYASATFSPNSSQIFSLSQAAIDDINGRVGGDFMLGFTNITLNQLANISGVQEGLYTAGDGTGPRLIVQLAAVPAPASEALLAIGLLGWLASRRKAV